MRIVMTLLVRDEVDVVDANLAFHLNTGVDFVIATDNGSEDGTAEALERYEREGCLRLLHEPGNDMRQAEWVTRMARLAAREHGADWVINADADEFWWSRKGPLKDVLERVPARFATVRGFMRNFVPRAGEGLFAERMTARLAPGELRPESRFHAHPFQPQDKVIHRAHESVALSSGNHEARWDGSIDLRGWWPLEVLHFPVRSPEQCMAKWRNWRRHGWTGYDQLLVGTPGKYFASLAVGDDELAAGVEEGWLAVDARLRDVLRALRAPEGETHERFLLSADGGPPVELPVAAAADDAALAADVSAASDKDAFEKAIRQVEDLERRLGLLESPPWRRLARRRRLAGGDRARAGRRQ